jgi:CheY-like chemotaxis protein
MMRQIPELTKMLIIAFTAWPEEQANEMARAYGCDGVITKPIDTRLFSQQVGHFIKA